MKPTKNLILKITSIILPIALLCGCSGETASVAETLTSKTVKLYPLDCSAINDTDGDGLGEFEGWGTSLCWWANRIGYSDALVTATAEAFFSSDGLNLNIARYNIGGGDNVTDDAEELEATDDETLHESHILRSDSAVPGYCTDVTLIDLETYDEEYYEENFTRVSYECGYAWNYDWTADANQLAVLKAFVEYTGEDALVEAFSNSPPYFMTVSGCTSGNEDASENNLREDSYEAFGWYLADVIEHLIDEELINVSSVSAMNEPATSYWSAYSSKQEGCHFDIGDTQSAVLIALNDALTEKGIDIIISASDETSVNTQIKSYNALSDEAKEIVDRIDTHAYSGRNYEELSALAEDEGKNLWMSETDGKYTAGTLAGTMSAALGLADEIIENLNGLEASAWILWNAIDVHADSSETGLEWIENGSGIDYESIEELEEVWGYTSSGYWGVAAADHDTGTLTLSMKYYAYGQFTKYITAGMTLIGSSSDGNVLAAYDPDEDEVVIVVVNTSALEKDYTFDLSEFDLGDDLSVTAIRTSGDLDDLSDENSRLLSGVSDASEIPTGSFEDGTVELWADVTDIDDICVDFENSSFSATLKANSITTYIISGVTGTDTAEEELTIVSNEAITVTSLDGSVPDLPDTAKITLSNGKTVSCPVTWNVDYIDYTELEMYETATVTGTVYGVGGVVEATVICVQSTLEYFIDCANTDSDFWLAASLLPTLINTDAADQEKTDSTSWGYLNTIEEDLFVYDGYDDIADIYAYGYWAGTGATIEYELTLPRGTHTITFGTFCWYWSDRVMEIYVSVNGKDEELLTTITAYGSDCTYQSASLSLWRESTVKISIRAAADNPDPVISFIAVALED